MLNIKHNEDLEISLNRLNITNRMPLFKAHVRTIRTRNKALGTNDFGGPINNILKQNKNQNHCSMYTKNKEIYTQIHKLQDFLLENKNIYLNYKSSIDNSTVSMNEKEKENIDLEVQNIIKLINSRLYELKKVLENNKHEYSEQLYKHYQLVVNFIDNYLKKVIEFYLNMKREHEKYTENYNKMYKLGYEKSKRMNLSFDNASFIEDVEKYSLKESQYGELSSEEIQTFKNENDSLYRQMTSLNEEVEQIESKVLKVAELQKQLTENIYDQAQTIEKTLNTFVGTTENINEGNEQLRQAIQGSATLRLFVILIFLVLSLTILFLHYYND